MADKFDTEVVAQHYKGIIEAVGEDPSREGMIDTPVRAAKAMEAITAGYRMSLELSLIHI